MRRWVVSGLWTAGIVVLLVGGFLANSLVKPPPPAAYTGRVALDEPGYSSNGTLEKPSRADLTTVQTALRTRAHAILDGDRAAFLGVVDGDRSAFAKEQRTVWQNTRQLHFQMLSYTYDGLVEPDAPLHTPSFLAQVTTTYELKGFDTAPIQVDDGFTFVKQDGTWKLASVTDAASQFNAKTLPVPWEGAPIRAYGDADYLAIVDRGQGALARHLVALCHEANTAAGLLLGSQNTRPTVVLATTHSRGFAKFSGPDALAVTYRLPTADGLLSGWRLVLNPEYVERVARDPVVLTHELTHLATQSYLPYLPAWLAEGTAEYVGWHTAGGLAAQARWRGYTSARSLPDLLPISANFYLQHVELNYVQGMALVTWIEQHRGSHAVLALMKAYTAEGTGNPSFDPDVATEHVLRSTLGMSSAELAREAYAGLNAVAGT
ncbi:MAG TPA: hypothetical protein VHW64_14760 [Nocardioides sp.]|uniref:hypothetical protein n=1 Tax=Nocardioides sp. TaxID=35761 RepID=UPI002E2FCEEF|nr:hypothetical protein [Nocardioides sp.]HEX3931962.1 hypothetical protein [Nocardioides sp.]